MMTKAARSLRPQARKSLDRRLKAWFELPNGAAQPYGGWVRAIREALGMTTADLAARMGVTQSTVTRLENSERRRTVRLDTLTRAAEALDCEVVYALVPRKPLEDLVSEQAERKALEQLHRLGHTMALEKQGLDDAQLQENFQLLLDHYLNSPGLWRRRSTTEPSARTSS